MGPSAMGETMDGLPANCPYKDTRPDRSYRAAKTSYTPDASEGGELNPNPDTDREDRPGNFFIPPEGT